MFETNNRLKGHLHLNPKRWLLLMKQSEHNDINRDSIATARTLEQRGLPSRFEKGEIIRMNVVLKTF